MSFDVNNLEAKLLEKYGPIMGGRDLIQALGYRSFPAFRRACREDILGVEVFTIPNRKGKFAMTSEIAGWLKKLSGGPDSTEK